MRGEGVDGRRAQARATEPAVDPAQVAQVRRPAPAGRRADRREARGRRCGDPPRQRTPGPYDGARDRRRRRGAHRPDRPPGRPGRRGARRRPVTPRPARSDGSARRRRSSADSRPTGSAGNWPPSLEADGVDLRWAPRTDAPTTLAIAELDEDGSATYRFHIAGDVCARPDHRGSPGRDRQRTGRGPRRDARPGRRADGDRDHRGRSGAAAADAPDGRSQLPGRRDRRSRGLRRAPPSRPYARRHRQGERRGPRLHQLRVRHRSTPRDCWSRPAPGSSSSPTDRARSGWSHLAWRSRWRVPLVKVVDTVGSGDAFGGAFLAALDRARPRSGRHAGRGHASRGGHPRDRRSQA